MTSTATGGFSTESGSIATFHSPTEEYVCALFCFLSGVNFTLLYASAVGLDIKKLIKNSEFRFLYDYGTGVYHLHRSRTCLSKSL